MAEGKSNSMMIAIIAILVIVVIAAAVILSGALNPAPDNSPGLSITTPQNGASVVGPNVTVTIAVSHFSIVDKLGQANVAGEGHVHYFLDVAVPTTPGQPAVTAPGTYAATVSTSYTWHNLSAGSHTLSALLVNNNHTPLEPAVYKTITVTVALPTSTVNRYLEAQNNAFNVSSLTVPAGALVQLHFENMDTGIQHNFALYTNSDHTGQLYLGSIITGVNSITYSFVAPSTPGTYYFRCEIHPTMTGTLIVT